MRMLWSTSLLVMSMLPISSIWLLWNMMSSPRLFGNSKLPLVRSSLAKKMRRSMWKIMIWKLLRLIMVVWSSLVGEIRIKRFGLTPKLNLQVMANPFAISLSISFLLIFEMSIWRLVIPKRSCILLRRWWVRQCLWLSICSIGKESRPSLRRWIWSMNSVSLIRSRSEQVRASFVLRIAICCMMQIWQQLFWWMVWRFWIQSLTISMSIIVLRHM